MVSNGDHGGAALRALLATHALLTPFTYLVNEGALKCESKGGTRAMLLLTYLSRPTDHLIQALALPALAVVYLVFNAAIPQSAGLRIFKIFSSPISMVAALGIALVVSTIKVADVAFQLLVPYQAIYAVCKAKRAVAEYFEWRARSEDTPVVSFHRELRIKRGDQRALNSADGQIHESKSCTTNGVINLCAQDSREKAQTLFDDTPLINGNVLWFCMR